MSEPTQCPVCGKTLQGSVDLITQHVNMCIDDNESVNYIKKLVGYGGWAFPTLQPDTSTSRNCPICGKEGGGEVRHLKKCGAEHEVDTKKLLQLYKAPAKKKGATENGHGSGPAVVRKRRPISKKNVLESNYVIASTSGSKFCLSRAPSRPLTNLTKLSEEEKEARIKERMNHVLETNIVVENCTYGTQVSLPYSWSLSSLNENDVKYIVDGFEKFCCKLDLNGKINDEETHSQINDKEELNSESSQPTLFNTIPTPEYSQSSSSSMAESSIDLLKLHTSS